MMLDRAVRLAYLVPHNAVLQVLKSRQAQISSLRQQLAGRKDDNAVLTQSISTLQQVR